VAENLDAYPVLSALTVAENQLCPCSSAASAVVGARIR
jgi:hypothetical protein